jgi:hypothetical protein
MSFAGRRMFEVQPPAVIIEGHNVALIASRDGARLRR